MEAAANVRAAKSTAVILRNFSDMTRLPRFLFGATRTWIGRPRVQTSNKGTNSGNLRRPTTRRRFISRYGKFKDRRDRWPATDDTERAKRRRATDALRSTKFPHP